MPAIWVLLFSPVAGWLADRFGRRNLSLVSMVVYAFVGAAPALLDNLYAIIAARIGGRHLRIHRHHGLDHHDRGLFQGRTRERWMASQTAVASISALGIIYLGGQLGAAYGWRGPFYLYIYSLVLASACLLRYGSRRRMRECRRGDARKWEAHVRFPWARMIGICAMTLLASICFYTVMTKNAEAMVFSG